MNTSAYYLTSLARDPLAAHAIGAIAPVAVWDFAAGWFSHPFEHNRASAAFGRDAAGRFSEYPAGQMRLDLSGARDAAILEPAASNLLSHAKAAPGSGWSLNGGSAAALSLGALGVFPGCEVFSSGARWHRLNHTACPAVIAGENYHLQMWFAFGSSGGARLILQNSNTGAESQIAMTETTATAQMYGAGSFDAIDMVPLGCDSAYLLSVAFTPNFSGPLSLGIGPDSVTTGDSVIIFGAQIEAGAHGSSFIESAGAPADRAADLLSWGAPHGIWDVRLTDQDGETSDETSVSVGAGWEPAPLPLAISSVALYPPESL